VTTTSRRDLRPHLAHWGAFEAEVADGALAAIRPFARDPDPSPILENIPGSLRHPTRVARPMIRSGWLDRGPGATETRGAEPFVPVSWDTLVDVLAGELRRVYRGHGGEAVFAGSYGWASAGRFHQAQSQLHRFLNLLGGYVASKDTYSVAAAQVTFPHIFGSIQETISRATSWPVLTDETEVWVCFGGIPLKNTAVSPGGATQHEVHDHLRRFVERGGEFALFSPLRDDLARGLPATWYPIAPGTDVAVMLAMAYVLISEGLHDRAFLDQYCAGFDRIERYVLGQDDGVPKTPEWASALSEVPAREIAALSRRLAGRRVMITTTWSLQRTEFGEQKPWMALTLAAVLGQIGLPGGGFGFGYGSANQVGGPGNSLGAPRWSTGTNAVTSFIPVARFADMMLNPGAGFDYDGGRYAYPDIRLVYWAGGNPFHHHQDLPKLRRALARAETVIVHDPFWTSMARHADIVVPSTMTLERNDIGGPPNDRYLVAMHQAVEPYEQARNDYDTYCDLAAALDLGERFGEARDETGWLRHLYEGWQNRARQRGVDLPDFDAFWERGFVEMPGVEERMVFLGAFRDDPEKAPLPTPSGRIELFSKPVADFGYDDCPGYPAWLEPTEWLGGARAKRFPLLMLANNPATRLHSQLDVGAYSQASKVQGREPMRMHPSDAAERGIADGNVARVYNDRGSFLAGVVLSEDVRRRVIQVSTGAWYDPEDPADVDAMCVHGNPNVVTLDAGSSRLAQGSVGQHTLVEVERWVGDLPPIRVHEPPAIQVREGL
jgi:biotin/methionine sulfoxide reductase